MSPAERLKVLLFLALFFGAVGFLFTLLSCGTEYWLLAAESCSRPEGSYGGGGGGGGDLRESRGEKGFSSSLTAARALCSLLLSSVDADTCQAKDGVRVFHEGLFWRCSFMALSNEFSVWDLWISNQPPAELCQAAFLFPFPVKRLESRGSNTELYEHHSAIVFRTFWSIFLVTGLTAVVIGGFVVICAGPLANHKVYKAGGALQLCGGLSLLAVEVMYLMWVQVLDTLEQFAHHQRVSSCPSYHLSIQHGPSFLIAPVAVFFCLLSGLLFILVSRSVQRLQLDKRDKTPELPASVADV